MKNYAGASTTRRSSDVGDRCSVARIFQMASFCIPEPMDEIADKQKVNRTDWNGKTRDGVEWQVHLGDAKTVLSSFDDETFNCVVTSPPYFWLRDYEVENQIGLEETVDGYVSNICLVMDQVYRTLKQDGILFLNMGDTYYSGKGRSHGVDKKSSKRRFGLRAVDKSGGLGIGLLQKSIIGIPWRVVLEMCTRGWILRSPIIWHRKHCLPEAVRDRPRRSYEYVFMFVKSRKYFFNRQILLDAAEEDMWTIVARPKSPNGLNTAPYPEELVARCLGLGCPHGGKVLDPFAGSGTTLRVALITKRPAVGIDLSPTFCEHIVEGLTEL